MLINNLYMYSKIIYLRFSCTDFRISSHKDLEVHCLTVTKYNLISMSNTLCRIFATICQKCNNHSDREFDRTARSGTHLILNSCFQVLGVL